MAAEGRTYRLSIMVDLQDRMQSALDRVTGSAAKFEQRLQNTARAAQTLDRQKIAPTIDGRDRLTGRLSGIGSSLRSLTGKAWTVSIKAKDEASKVVDKIGNTLSKPLAMLGIGASVAGTGALLTTSGGKAMDFEAQLSSIKALTGATAEEMERLRTLSLRLGADTKYSALEAAQGFEELLKAGLSVKQVEDGGAEAALNLATAGGLQLAEAAEIMSTAMNAFKADNLSAAQAANILAGTANASATGVTELKYSLAAVSAVASGVGMNFQDVNVALGLFANNGLKGSDAGTSLKSMLMNMVPDTKKAITEFERLGLMTEQGTSAFFNQEGQLKSLAEISELLQKALSGMTNEQRLASMQVMFGADAIRAANILYKEGADGVKKFTSEMLKVTALDVAKEKMNNTKGAIEEMSGSFETLQIRAMTPFLPLVTRIATGFGNTFDNMTDTVVARAESMAAGISGFLDELASDEKFQAMDWGDKIVYVLDRMVDALDTWSSEPGGEQFGKVFAKLAEIGMKGLLTAVGGLFKAGIGAALSGNFTSAIGLTIGANVLSGGLLMKSIGGLAKGAGKLLEGKDISKLIPGFGQKSATDALLNRKLTGFLPETSSAANATKAGGGLLSRFGGTTARLLGRAALPVGMAIDAVSMLTSQQDNMPAAVGGYAGRWGGAVVGSKAGASVGGAIGTAIMPILGTAIGAVVGSIVGGAGGYFAGDKVGAKIGELVGNYKEHLTAFQTWTRQTVDDAGAWFQALPERIGFGIGYTITWISLLPERTTTYFSEVYSTATAWTSQTVDDVISWISSLPGQAEAGWQSVWQATETWAANSYNSVVNWFSNIPSAIATVFEQAVQNISAKAAGVWSTITSGISSGFASGSRAASIPGHAAGGIFDRPHMALFAEEGAESVIPLSPSRRARALEIWEQTGNALGVKQYADGGFTRASDSPTAATSGGLIRKSGDVNVQIDRLDVAIGNAVDEEAMVVKIGRAIVSTFMKAAENSA